MTVIEPAPHWIETTMGFHDYTQGDWAESAAGGLPPRPPKEERPPDRGWGRVLRFTSYVGPISLILSLLIAAAASYRIRFPDRMPLDAAILLLQQSPTERESAAGAELVRRELMTAIHALEAETYARRNRHARAVLDQLRLRLSAGQSPNGGK